MTELKRKTTVKKEDDVVFYEEEVPRYTTPCCKTRIPVDAGSDDKSRLAICKCGKKWFIYFDSIIYQPS